MVCLTESGVELPPAVPDPAFLNLDSRSFVDLTLEPASTLPSVDYQLAGDVTTIADDVA